MILTKKVTSLKCHEHTILNPEKCKDLFTKLAHDEKGFEKFKYENTGIKECRIRVNAIYKGSVGEYMKKEKKKLMKDCGKCMLKNVIDDEVEEKVGEGFKCYTNYYTESDDPRLVAGIGAATMKDKQCTCSGDFCNKNSMVQFMSVFSTTGDLVFAREHVENNCNGFMSSAMRSVPKVTE